MTVEDNGVGIPPEVAARVFDPFFSTSTRDRKRGLGLSTAHGIVSEHGGRLTFDSASGQGARFYVDLPAQS